MPLAAAKLATVAIVLGGIWEQLGPKIAIAATVIGGAAAAYRELVRPMISMVKHAGDVYENLTTMDSRVTAKIAEIKTGQDDLSGQVQRLATNARAREDELEKRIAYVEAVVETMRSILGTRSSDHPPRDPASETG